MLYHLTLGDREIQLELEPPQAPGEAPARVVVGDRAHEVTVLSHRPGELTVLRVNDRVFRLRVERNERDPSDAAVVINGRRVPLVLQTELEKRSRRAQRDRGGQSARVVAPMPGRIVQVHVAVGDVVQRGAPLLGIEAMKMENALFAPDGGRVTQLLVQAHDTVEANQELLLIEPE